MCVWVSNWIYLTCEYWLIHVIINELLFDDLVINSSVDH